jgi:hypothetical protein
VTTVCITVLRALTLGVTLFVTAALPASAQTSPSQTSGISQQEAYEIARDAYLYAYPIVTMDVSMRQSTNVPNANTVPLRAPVNQLAHARTYPKADDRTIVRYNFDTLYSLAWLDLSREPIVLSVPDMPDRYYLIPMLDMWTDVFAVVGSRTTGSKAGHYAIVPPGWNGTLPEGVQQIVAPTSTIWVIGRTQTNGPVDYDNVHKVQDGYKLTPLSQWGKVYTPSQNVPIDTSVDDKTEPMKQVNAMDGVAVLGRLAELMAKFRPHANDYPILFRLRRLGLEPGKPFDTSKLDPTLVKTVNTAARDALAGLGQTFKKGVGTHANGWSLTTQNVGTYGTAYKDRALAAMVGLGANLPEDAVYPVSVVDADGKPYDGAKRYVLHFEKSELPPADAFWSITLYDNEGYQVPNPLNRFVIGDRDKFTFKADGSLDIYVQNASPGADKASNWLPAPQGAFNLVMRLYSPRREVLDGQWMPPVVRKAM